MSTKNTFSTHVALVMSDGRTIRGRYVGETSRHVTIVVRGLKVKVPVDEIADRKHVVVE